ncbi:hypothetical protein D3C87_2120480 [compost metagenome]
MILEKMSDQPGMVAASSIKSFLEKTSSLQSVTASIYSAEGNSSMKLIVSATKRFS